MEAKLTCVAVAGDLVNCLNLVLHEYQLQELLKLGHFTDRQAEWLRSGQGLLSSGCLYTMSRKIHGNVAHQE